LDADDAAEVISLLEPRIVIPMHYKTPITNLPLDALNRFLKEMGVAEAAPQETLRIARNQLPDETEIIVLECKQG
jgi:L-ascorbate metabolism protein UlaG (beta-lactamase superfamily)